MIDVSAVNENTNGPTCSLRMYLLRIFNGRQWRDEGETCKFHQPAWPIQGLADRTRTDGGFIPLVPGLVRVSRLLTTAVRIVIVVPALLQAQAGRRDSTARAAPPPASGSVVSITLAPAVLGLPVAMPMTVVAVRMPRPAAADSAKRATNVFGAGSDLALQFNTRIEGKAERTVNERCNASQYANPLFSCSGRLLPDFTFQFNMKSGGTIADRFHVDVDYDSQREFDASNNISLYYQGREGSHLSRVEVGNVSFTPPPSRFITSAIPSGNYGVQALGQFGPMRVRTIAAQQKGNVIQSHSYTIGDRTLQGSERDIEDYQVEARRVFFTVDPALFRDYPNIDLLDRAQLSRLYNSLPDTLRPTQLYVYRLQFGAQPQDPNGPRFKVRTDSGAGQPYDVLREGVDYYLDPSHLWIMLVRPLNQNSERLVVAYRVRLNGAAGGRDTTWVTTGGTPDLRYTGRPQYANLIWDPRVRPTDPEFRREVRSVYRIAGQDLQRQSVQLRVLTGAGGQEKPLAGRYDTFLQMFGLAQLNNSAQFDIDNRLWPRPGDPVFNLGAGAGDVGPAGLPGGGGGGGGLGGGAVGSRVIQDYYLFFPSLRPFSIRESGLVVPGNPPNDSIYTTPGEYLSSPQHPTTVYRLRVSYQTAGTSEAGTLMLGSVQVRRNSERITIEGRPLVRDVDYHVDYDLGRVSFTRPDTLFLRPRQVSVSFEENPLFANTPTSLFGLVSELPSAHGQLNFAAITQRQGTSFTRPQLGFEPVSSLLAGVSGQYAWEAPLLSRLAGRLPFGSTAAPSRFAIAGEVATSHPQPNSAGQAYIESFEGQGGTLIPLSDYLWLYSSQPPAGRSLGRIPFASFDLLHASTMAWQNNPVALNGQAINFYLSQIDPLATLGGLGVGAPEQILWMTLYPLTVGGRYDPATRRYDWMVGSPNAPSGRRWRSIRTVLSPTGVDLTRAEYLQFWALVDTTSFGVKKNPTLVFDFGEISENSVDFAPDTLFIRRNSAGGIDSIFTGKKLVGYDTLNTERDPFSHAFDVGVNDTGLPGDVSGLLVVRNEIDGTTTVVDHAPLCEGFQRIVLLGDTRADCTRHNNRLDEEDIDLDGAMNFTQPDAESILRFVVDLSDPSRYTRVGAAVNWQDSTGTHQKQWVLVKVPFAAPNDSLGNVLLRRIRALRITMVSGPQATDQDFTQIGLDQLKLVGAPWLKRSPAVVTGIAGEAQDGGYVITSVIGTADSTRGVAYESPPGITSQLDTKVAQFQPALVQINEQSLRIQAGQLNLYDRAEAYYRFPSTQQNFMAYRELRLWGRGRKNGWGPSGELQMFVKVGRDENNFYMYRTPVNAGSGQNAWLPQIHIQLSKFYDLRKKLETSYLQHGTDSLSCTGIDSALVVHSALPAGIPAHRYAACDNGYMVYTIDPSISPPNLASVQEMSVGLVRVAPPGTSPAATMPGDTLELWVDDITLYQATNDPGYAGQLAVNLVAADFADFRATIARKNPNFRQLNELPSFIDEQSVDLASTVRLEKLLPRGAGVTMPFTVTKISSDNQPLFLSQTDIRGGGIPGLRTPKTDLTTYSLSVRRTQPLQTSLIGPLLNNLSITSTYVSGTVQNEYQSGSTNRFFLTFDYLVADSARSVTIPSWLGGLLGSVPDPTQVGPAGAPQRTLFRWNPAQLRLTSAITRGTDRHLSFLKPAAAADDPGNLSLALTNLWRNGSTLELRPTAGVALRWDAVSLRDLRQYGDTNAAAQAASAERGRMLGLDVGLERERTLQGTLSITPQIASWIRPRLDIGTLSSMLRDPNSRYLVSRTGVTLVDSVLTNADSIRTTAAASAYTLPRRLTSTQSLSAGATLDLGRLMTLYTRDSSVVRSLARVFAPLDINVSRNLLSAFDAAAFAPPLPFQLGIGGPGSFRMVDGTPASTAGLTTTLAASNSLLLPFSTALVNRFRRTTTRNWASQLDNTQARVDGAQTVFPDLSLRWTWRPPALGAVLTSIAGTVGYSASAATTTLPSDFTGANPPQLRVSHLRSYPLNGSILWGGGLSTAAGYTLTKRVDSLPGSFNHGQIGELNADVGRAFTIPKSWGFDVKNPVRARFGWQQAHSRTIVTSPNDSVSSRLVDNGRTALSLNADTDLSETLLFTLQASRVITFDNNLNRRLNQLVLSTVLQIQFYGGSK